MSAYGRWREAEEQKFEAWWKEFVGKGWLVRYVGPREFLRAVAPRDAEEVDLARNAALNAWMKAKWKEAPDD